MNILFLKMMLQLGNCLTFLRFLYMKIWKVINHPPTKHGFGWSFTIGFKTKHLLACSICSISDMQKGTKSNAVKKITVTSLYIQIS